MRCIRLFHQRLVYMFVFLWLVACTALPMPGATPTPVGPTPTPFRPYFLSPVSSQSKRSIYANPGNDKVGFVEVLIGEEPDQITAILFYPVKEDGIPETVGAPFPLVVFSPGGFTNGSYYRYLLQHLASHGFVVITWNSRDGSPLDWWQAYATRPKDLKQVIRFADQIAAPGGQLDGLIDMGHIGLAGHSAGGMTALLGGGAQWDTGWCTAYPDLVAQNEWSACSHFVPKQQEIAAALGLESAPLGLWPKMNDPRVAAVVAMAPNGDIWGAEFEGVAGINLPTLVMAGSEDTIIDPKLFTYPLYQHLVSPKKSLIVFEKKDHSFFFGYDPDTFLINHFMTAYLMAELKDDPEAARALAPSSVTFPGVQYETSEFNNP